MTKKRTKLEWQQDEYCQELAGKLADEMAEHFKLVAPVDPFEVIRHEHPLLVAGGRDFGDRFDGKLKYNKDKKRFLLFYNTRYDRWQEPGTHHPRTRFSICHELGHYFIDAHHKYLLRGGRPHPSRGEFKTAAQMEREADAFASSLLLPTHLTDPVLNNGELTIGKIDKVATDFGASLLCTAIRGIRLSDLPCAIAGIRDGRISWLFPSKPLIAAKCYPGKKELESPAAKVRWSAFATGEYIQHEEDCLLRYWFQTFDREEELYDIEVTQAFMPIPIMDTLLVLLTMTEEDVILPEEEEEDDLDREHRERFGW